MKQIALTAALMLLAASLTANYFLYKQSPSIPAIDAAEME